MGMVLVVIQANNSREKQSHKKEYIQDYSIRIRLTSLMDILIQVLDNHPIQQRT